MVCTSSSPHNVTAISRQQSTPTHSLFIRLLNQLFISALLPPFHCLIYTIITCYLPVSSPTHTPHTHCLYCECNLFYMLAYLLCWIVENSMHEVNSEYGDAKYMLMLISQQKVRQYMEDSHHAYANT